MKKYIFFLLLLLVSNYSGKAQFYKSLLTSSEFSDSLSKIVMDYKSNFNKIQGIEMTTQPEMKVFQSKTSLPGAVHCSIFRYHSLKDTSASWQAIFYDGESYEAAFKIYKETYNLLKRSKMKNDDKSVVTFIGNFGKPKESVRFTSSSLQLNSDERIYRNFFAQLELTSTYDGWEVQLNLIEKIIN